MSRIMKNKMPNNYRTDNNKRKYRLFLASLFIVIFTAISVAVGNTSYNYVKGSSNKKSVAVDNTQIKFDSNYKVWPSGEMIGIYVKTKGVLVIKVGAFTDINGCSVSPCEKLVEKGDYIVGINGETVENKVDFVKKLGAISGDKATLNILRGQTSFDITVDVKKDPIGSNKLGIWVKDDIAGIGTLTFVDDKGFAALGHSINDSETGERFDISEGAIYNARLLNILKPEKDKAGRLEGIIDYSSNNMIGKVNCNEYYGISGYVTKNFHDNKEADMVTLGGKEDVHEGNAYIISYVDGTRQSYDIVIEKINYNSDTNEKNMEIKVVDERLLNLTGGIVQGMSGTPIIQDGKLVGAVTHVFINDSTRGYGILIEEMLKNNR